MLYRLTQYLSESGLDFPGLGLMQYITFRSICSSIVALFCAIVLGKKIIAKLQKKQIGETIRDLGLEGQMQKKGTPTMGGIIIILSILIPILLFGDLSNTNIILLLITTVWLGFLGFADDFIKVFKKNKDGLKPMYKIVGQVGLGLVVGLTICFSSSLGFREQGTKKQATEVVETTNTNTNTSTTTTAGPVLNTGNIKTTIPFFKDNEFDYKWLSPFKGKVGELFSWILYIIIIIFIITACSNGSNLTDGMDGLNAGVSAIIGIVLGILAYLSGHTGMSDYLNIMYIPSSAEMTVFAFAFIGALLGFLWFNSFPAQVFMGDTGSLAIGGIIGVFAILIRKELMLPILCGIYLTESLSVILQRFYFKYTKKKYGEGRRIFKMAPLHHHFQKEDVPALIKKPYRAQPEAKIVIRFWIASIILAILTIVTLKIR